MASSLPSLWEMTILYECLVGWKNLLNAIYRIKYILNEDTIIRVRNMDFYATNQAEAVKRPFCILYIFVGYCETESCAVNKNASLRIS